MQHIVGGREPYAATKSRAHASQLFDDERGRKVCAATEGRAHAFQVFDEERGRKVRSNQTSHTLFDGDRGREVYAATEGRAHASQFLDTILTTSSRWRLETRQRVTT